MQKLFAMKLANKSNKTLRKELYKLKDKKPKEKENNIVTKINCSDYSRIYIGECCREAKIS